MGETERLCRQEARPGTRITTQKCDVSDEKQVKAFCAYVKDQHQTDHINLLFNNAGIGGGGRVAETSTQAFDQVMNVNLRGTFFCCRAGFRQMKQQGGG